MDVVYEEYNESTDQKQLLKLESEIFRLDRTDELSTETLVERKSSNKLVKNDLHAFVARDKEDDRIIGFLYYMFDRVDDGNPYIFIDKLGVVEEERRGGHATELMNKLMDEVVDAFPDIVGSWTKVDLDDDNTNYTRLIMDFFKIFGFQRKSNSDSKKFTKFIKDKIILVMRK